MPAIHLFIWFIWFIPFISFGSSLAAPVDDGPSSLARRLPSGATVYQLSRMGSLVDEDGILDQEKFDNHIRYVLRKQIEGAMNYYMNTGNVLATFNMTPYQLEDAYNTGALPLVEDTPTDGTAAAVRVSQTVGSAETPSISRSQSGPISPLLRASARGGAVPMNNLAGKDLIWAAPIQIGTPSKTFFVSIDTGSSDLFVASDRCPTAQCAGKNLYLPSESATAVPTGRNFSIGFGDGSSVKAVVMRDTVTVAGQTLPNMGFGAVTQLSPQFQSSTGDTSDGLMGFGFPSLSQSKSDPFFTTLTKADPQMGVIGTKFVGRSVSGSELTLGGVNPLSFRGPFTTLNVLAMTGQQAGFWDVEFEGASVNGRPVQLTSTIATIDTGTSIIGVPQADARAIYASIPGSAAKGGGQYSFPCAANPMLSMNFGGRAFNVNPQDMSIGKDRQGNCVGGIVGTDRQGVWLVGQVFLKNVYTAYDQRNYTVSFADLA
ncbi:aspartic peptidase A1 [Melampsora americana]|nr:aspartic peptidase A1 [Melampsora americana]